MCDFKIVEAPHARHRWMTAFLALSLVVSASMPASAAERVWDGGARDDGWNAVGNWVGTGVPVAGDSLRFPAGALQPSNNNDFPAGTPFNLLTYAGAGYTASGNEIGLTGGIVVSHGAGNTILNLPINVALNQTFMVSVAGANLFLNGGVDLVGTRTVLTFDGAGQTVVVGDISDVRAVIAGGTIRKNGTGTLYVLQNLTLGGPTIVNGGTLIMDGRTSNSAVTVNASATLRGTGKVGGLTVNSGGTVGPGLSSPDILDSLGDVALNAGSTFNVRLNGTTVGINYDQLKVRGTVSLGGTLNLTAGFTAAVGDIFTIIDNDGTDDTVGTFAGLPEGAILTLNGRPFKISYGGRGGLGGVFGRDVNDVTLEAVPALAVWDRGGGLNKFWSEPLNWVGDVVPMPGDDLQFADSAPGTLTTINDFPAGRVLGSLIFGAGEHLVEGNLASVKGNLRISESNHVAISMPMTFGSGLRLTEPGELFLNGALTLSADQVFWVDDPGARLQIGGSVDIGAYDLVLRINSAATISGSVSGSGTITKEGAGFLALQAETGLILGPGPIVVHEGTFTVIGQFMGTDVFSPVIVNTGAVLRVAGFAGISDVEVRGGSLVPGFATVDGAVRLLDGATFSPSIEVNAGPGVAVTTYISGVNSLELAGCILDLHVAPNTPITPGTPFGIIRKDSGSPPTTGAFNGLPEGSRFLAGGHAFTITYQGGAAVIADAPFVWDGGGSGNVWGTAANWEADLAPIPGSALIFPANVSKVGMINAFDAGTSFRSLTFGGPSYLVVGNLFRLTEGIYNDVASGDTRITANFVASGNSFTSRISSASRLLLEGGVTGNANWRKTGTGTLRFAGTLPNSLGEVEVREGELELDKTPNTDAISSRLDIGDGTNDVRVTLLGDHQIADNATVTIRNRARLDLNGQDEAIDRLQGDGLVSLDGRFIPGRSARLTISNGLFKGTIVGDGGLTKAGSSFSSSSLSGQNTFSGMTIVSGGTLSVEGIQVDSPIRLDGGTLRGRGSVGTITGNLGGTLQPGSGGADYLVALHSLSIALNPATTFRALLTSGDPGYENHKLQVNGAVNLGGSILSVDLSGSFKPTNGVSFVIIDNDGADPVLGTFAGLPEGTVFGGDGLPFRISYVGGTGNDVVLTRVATPPSTLSSITTLSNAQIKVEGLGIVGVAYPIQAASNLNPVIIWTPVGSATGNASGLFQYLDTSASNRPMRFYRAISP
jgi:autotransporter-associated beta strand protein